MKADGIFSFLLQGTGTALIIQVAAVLSAMGLQVLFARWMGLHQFGVYALATSWLALIVTVGKMGFDTASLKFVATYEGLRQWGSLRGFLQRSRQLVGAASVVITIAGLAVSWCLKNRISPELWLSLQIAFLGVPLATQTNLLQCGLRGFRRVAAALLPEPLLRTLLMVLLAAGVFMISGGLTAPAVTGIHIVALGIVLAGAVVYFHRLSRTLVPSEPKSYHTREWLSVALPAMFIEVMALMHSQTDIIMVGFFRGSRDVGLFAAATKVASLVTFCLSSANIVLAPAISRMFARGEMADLQRMVCMVCRIMMILASTIALVLIFGGGRIMSLFGPDFTVASKVLAILALAQLANALTGPSGYLMTMTGHQYAMAYLVAGVILLKIILNLILIPLWGIEGAAFATMVTTVILNILLVIVIRKLLGIRISIFARS